MGVSESQALEFDSLPVRTKCAARLFMKVIKDSLLSKLASLGFDCPDESVAVK